MSNTNPQSLHVPQNNSFSMGSVNDIMKAYNSQSKIQLYDESSAMSNDEISGVKGRDIPLSALRAKTPVGTDENGNPVYSKSKLVEDMERRKDIAIAYNKMNGIEESDEEDVDYSGVKSSEAEYIEDVPESDEGLLMYLETIIRNARANLEMLESLYAALSPQN